MWQDGLGLGDAICFSCFAAWMMMMKAETIERRKRRTWPPDPLPRRPFITSASWEGGGERDGDAQCWSLRIKKTRAMGETEIKGSIVVTGLDINYPTIWILSDDSLKNGGKIILTI
uniref:Uncharacterized protein n=1 Tax=Oryza nivara TaxID=4536 RepID=A0A0E0I0C1_ORYNI